MFHINLKEIREEKGLTQDQLAKQVNVVRQTVSKWERGLSMPDVDLLMRIAEVLECKIDRLLGCEETIDMSALAIQLAMLNQQFSIKNRREEKIWDTVSLVVKIFFGIFIAWIAFLLIAVISTFLIFSSGGEGSSHSISESMMLQESIPIHE